MSNVSMIDGHIDETRMTDNDIKKALELCATIDSGNCKKCPCREICNENDGTLTKLTLDLINRKNAEIERLKHRKTELQIRNQELQHEKSEAIKKFAEKLKNCFAISRDYLDIINIIDNLVKEMVGDPK